MAAGNATTVANTFLDGNYNITKLLSVSPVDNPERWLSVFNQEFGSWAMISILAVIGVVLYFSYKSFNPEARDSFAISFAGVITSLLGTFLFLIDVFEPSIKLIYWYQLAPIIIITAFAIAIDRFRRQY